MAAESKLEKYLIKRVKEFGGQTRKVRFLDRRGAPDRMVWLPSWRFPKLIEMKAPGKQLKAHQKREHIRLMDMGFKCFKLDNEIEIDRFLNG